MTHQQCGNCKHRGPRVVRYDGETVEDVELPYFTCNRVKHVGDSSERPAGQGAVVEDGSGHYAALLVEEDFGCVLWEQCEDQL